MDLSLASPIQYVPRVGPAMAGKLDILGIHTVYDLLTHIPFRYNDYSIISPIKRVQIGETVTVKATIESVKNVFTKTGKKLQMGVVSDSSGSIEVTWFNQIFLPKLLKKGDTVYLSGQVGWFGPKKVMLSPEYEKVSGDPDSPSLHTGRIVPVYPETEGISSKWLRGRVAFLISECKHLLIDSLPPEIRERHKLLNLSDAVAEIHFPTSLEAATHARKRLAFEELFYLLLSGYEQKRLWQTEYSTKPLALSAKTTAGLLQKLPFELTPDQQNAVSEILRDLAIPIPMNRLLEGDVGAGKTVVAAIAMYTAFSHKRSSILLAPTQILAQQHYNTLKMLLDQYNIPISLIVGGTKNPDTTQVGIYVGTHALLATGLTFPNVSLITIDEQQRFGVAQRGQLQQQFTKTDMPHVLTMTATPIPRTIAQVIFGNLDLSVLTTVPKGRKQIKTWVVPQEKRTSAYGWIQKEIDAQHTQCFVVCPLIDESETLSTVKAAKTEFEHLTKVFPKLSIGLLHGRLAPKEKTAILDRFRNKKIDILVSTPVVEVGIDIPNATIMVIEAADRFGLSQLHQLRGRVGRSDLDSYCLLFTENTQELTLKRLKAMETIHNGPELAELDLLLRGPGEIYGTAQHGIPNLKVAQITDSALIADVRRAVNTLTSHDSSLESFPLLRERLKQSKIASITS
jgi:ATP-dependent DNA helicase RecG